MKVFFDTEFTGLHQKTTLVSIGLVSEDGRTFYAETKDYDVGQLNDWLNKNVIANLRLLGDPPGVATAWELSPGCWEMVADSVSIANMLEKWLAQFPEIEMWSDVLTYDWMLFRELFNNDIPKNIYYIPFDLATLFWVAGLDPDLDREHYAGVSEDDEWVGPPGKKHNALWDARVIKACHKQYMESGGKDA